ncbi:hypothetical protein RHSIM_Rhsim11G0079800 [Rhododendron simsii]|uniref:non-specific serine/threonine protein kinase n=1 Tax=Rhododendron simsii TaxID=118357 RepID=A0A834G504_RHOSS|nr:hypothetical protein RHSIM_Rhsim11G0079800 [Rhododendron simsii]
MNPEKWVFNLLLSFLFFRICTSIDTLTPNQSIKDGNVLVSSGETFALGFFSPENSSRRYVGIWYNKIPEHTVIWVANRNRGIKGTSGVLSLNWDGNLVIYDNTRNSTVWQTNASAVSYLARLLDSGNLVLLQGDRGSGGGVWQSFDYPTNTVLPNMKLGLDRRTGLERFLTSWKSRDDPNTGEYSFRLELNELPQLILFKGSNRMWRMPTLLGSAKAEDMASSITQVNNCDEAYSSYTLINASNPLRIFVNELGYLKMVQWVGRWVEFYSVPGDHQCVAYGRCGAYGFCDPNNGQDFECTCLPGYEPRSTEEWNLRDTSGGCIKKRKELSMCGNREGFVKVADAKIPDTSKTHVRMNLSMHECKDECSRNCSCLAYTIAEGRVGAICITWYENLMDVKSYVRRFLDGGLDLYVRVDAVELAQRRKSRRLKQKKVVVVVTSVVLTSLLFIILVGWLVMKKRRRETNIKQDYIMLNKHGYMAPEYAIDGLFSTKSDIFSFGVIVLEIMSGKRNRKFHHADHDLNLLGHAWKLWMDGKAFELIDPVMEGSFPMSKVLRCLQIGLLCVQKSPEDRPTMSSVVVIICTSIDTLTPNQSIIDGDVLVSSGGTVALGFFRPGNSGRTYVGIWYNKISEQTFVWVANRDRPINGTFGVLSLNRDGNLVIYDNTRNFTVWHTNVSAVAYSARLLDSGNLVLCQGDGGSGGIVWQSFDHPTNTLLPNMKLGWNRRTGLERFLTSWKSTDDPSTGENSLRLELNELPQLILFKGASSRVWRLPTRLKRQRSAKAEDMAGSIFNGTVVNNLDEVYTSYTLINASNLSTMFVDELGTLKMVTWVGKWVEFYSVVRGAQCVAYGRCGAYGYCNPNNGQDFECTCLPGYEPRSAEEWNLRDASDGCIKKREELSMCKNGEGFVKVENAKIPDTSKARVWMGLSAHECKDECLRNCSCLAYTSTAEGGARAICVTWYENLMDVRRYVRRFPEDGLDLFVRVDAVELAQRRKSRRLKQRKVAVVVTSVVLASVLFIILVGWLVMKKRRRGIDIQDSDEESVELPIFDMVTLAEATNNFSDTNKIGKGGFGSVYKVIFIL